MTFLGLPKYEVEYLTNLMAIDNESKCMLTGELMYDPHSTKHQTCYEQRNITNHLKAVKKDPINFKDLDETGVFPDESKRKKIYEKYQSKMLIMSETDSFFKVVQNHLQEGKRDTLCSFFSLKNKYSVNYLANDLRKKMIARLIHESLIVKNYKIFANALLNMCNKISYQYENSYDLDFDQYINKLQSMDENRLITYLKDADIDYEKLKFQFVKDIQFESKMEGFSLYDFTFEYFNTTIKKFENIYTNVENKPGIILGRDKFPRKEDHRLDIFYETIKGNNLLVGIIEENVKYNGIKFNDFIAIARSINYKNDWNMNKNLTCYNYSLKANSLLSIRTYNGTVKMLLLEGEKETLIAYGVLADYVDNYQFVIWMNSKEDSIRVQRYD